MANTIVEIVFPWGNLKYYAIYRGFDGRLLTWIDLDVIISKTESEKLPENIRNNLGLFDSAAWVQTREEAQMLLEAIRKS